MVTAGVDLSTQRGKTAVAVVRWDGGSARVTDCHRPTDDGFVLDLVRGAAKVGIDSPLGWPDEFLRFVTDHAAGNVEVRAGETGEEQRRRLTWRLTDQVVRAAGHQPLTVAADKIGHVAMRAARLLALLAAEQGPIDRAGSGVVVEVYPAASLKRWGFAHRQYKGTANSSARLALVEELRRRLPWLDLGVAAEACRASDDALDAVVAALTARAAALGFCTSPTAEQREQAAREGWIALPTCETGRLLDG